MFGLFVPRRWLYDKLRKHRENSIRAHPSSTHCTTTFCSQTRPSGMARCQCQCQPWICAAHLSSWCLDAVGWATGRASGMWNVGSLVCWWWQYLNRSLAWLIAPVTCHPHFHHPYNPGSLGKRPLQWRKRERESHEPLMRWNMPVNGERKVFSLFSDWNRHDMERWTEPTAIPCSTRHKYF